MYPDFNSQIDDSEMERHMAEFKEKDNTGSLWLTRYKETGEVKKTKDGDEYFSGHCLIGGKKYFVNLFDNRQKKKHERSPDFSLMFNEPQWQSKGINPVSRAKEESGVPF